MAFVALSLKLVKLAKSRIPEEIYAPIYQLHHEWLSYWIVAAQPDRAVDGHYSTWYSVYIVDQPSLSR